MNMVKFKFTGEVNISRAEKDSFLDAFDEKNFDFFRYLADNNATFTLTEETKKKEKGLKV